MGIFDLLTGAHTEITVNKMLQKKIDEVAQQLTIGKLLAPKEKKKANSKKTKQKTSKETPDLSMEKISLQIIKQRDSIKQNGFKYYEFIANKNCCDVCAAINGKHFSISKFAIGVNAPPMHDKCRCSISAWVDDKDYDAWLDFLANGGTTEEWEAIKKKKRKS